MDKVGDVEDFQQNSVDSQNQNTFDPFTGFQPQNYETSNPYHTGGENFPQQPFAPPMQTTNLNFQQPVYYNNFNEVPFENSNFQQAPQHNYTFIPMSQVIPETRTEPEPELKNIELEMTNCKKFLH
jgi:hypothetical protein